MERRSLGLRRSFNPGLSRRAHRDHDARQRDHADQCANPEHDGHDGPDNVDDYRRPVHPRSRCIGTPGRGGAAGPEFCQAVAADARNGRDRAPGVPRGEARRPGTALRTAAAGRRRRAPCPVYRARRNAPWRPPTRPGAWRGSARRNRPRRPPPDRFPRPTWRREYQRSPAAPHRRGAGPPPPPRTTGWGN